jgi:hypothetical protein
MLAFGVPARIALLAAFLEDEGGLAAVGTKVTHGFVHRLPRGGLLDLRQA